MNFHCKEKNKIHEIRIDFILLIRIDIKISLFSNPFYFIRSFEVRKCDIRFKYLGVELIAESGGHKQNKCEK